MRQHEEEAKHKRVAEGEEMLQQISKEHLRIKAAAEDHEQVVSVMAS